MKHRMLVSSVAVAVGASLVATMVGAVPALAHSQSSEAVVPSQTLIVAKDAPHPAAVARVSYTSHRTPRGQRVVEAALAYLGAPYAIGGASHFGIDCSGLVMRAYQAVGIHLAHYVPTQDAMGVPVSSAAAKPGDLVVFDDEEHIGVYLGRGRLVAAPEEGEDVQVQPVSDWAGIGYHFTHIPARSNAR